MKTVDPITVATTWHYIQRVCREMRETTERTATNVLVVTLHDMAYGIWDANARAIAIPEGFLQGLSQVLSQSEGLKKNTQEISTPEMSS